MIKANEGTGHDFFEVIVSKGAQDGTLQLSTQKGMAGMKRCEDFTPRQLALIRHAIQIAIEQPDTAMAEETHRY